MTTADLEAASLADACPGCVANLEPPAAWMRLPRTWRCGYLCGHCGHVWTTDWRTP